MAADVSHIPNLMIENFRERLGEEIELIFMFGSREKGTAHPKSDFDMCYVPVLESTWAHRTVTVEDILFDLFPQHWSQLECKANFGDPGTSLMMDARVVYHRTEEALARFRGLQDRIRELEQPAARPQMVAKAQQIFRQTGYPFLQLRLAVRHDDLLSGKAHARQIVGAVTHCLMVANQTHIDTRKLPQVLALPRLPKDCGLLLDRIYATSDVGDLAAACEMLLERTRAFLLAEQRALSKDGTTYAEEFRSLYPELKDMVQHILRGCEAEDPCATTDAVLVLQEETASPLARVLTGAAYTSFQAPANFWHHLAEQGFPDLLSAALAPDYVTLREQATAFDRRLRELLTEHSVPLNDFADTEELAAHLEGCPPNGWAGQESDT